jgi:predicted nucleotidyltransferase component of viral defense system
MIPSYSLDEMLAEKVRAVSGQRRFAVSRDIYDIYQLQQHGVELNAVRRALPTKFAAKNMQLGAVPAAELQQKRELFEGDWQRRLVHLLPPSDSTTFDVAWSTVTALLTQLGA